jgi:hypothetical protein
MIQWKKWRKLGGFEDFENLEFLRYFWCSCFILVSDCGYFLVVVFDLEMMVGRGEWC